MPLPVLPLLLLAGVAVAALATKDNGASGGASPGGPGGAPGGGPLPPGGLAPIPPGGPIPGNPFDANLTPAQLQAVQTALATENDPSKLDALSKAMLPDHPLASAALEARANLLRLHGGGGGIAPPPPLPIPSVPVTPIPVPVTPAAIITPAGNATVHTSSNGSPGSSGWQLGRLRVRSTTSTASDANIVGQLAPGARIMVTGPAQAGMLPVTGQNALDNGTMGGAISGFASSQYIVVDGQAAPAVAPMPSPVAPLVQPASFTPNNLQTATVTTHDTGPSGNLNVRATPNGTVIGAVAHGATIVITGPQTAGFWPMSGHDANTGAPISGFVSAGVNPSTGVLYVTPNALPAVAAGFAPSPAMMAPSRVQLAAGLAMSDVATGPQLPFSELHAAALALKTALDTNGCKSYNEPVVKRFQHAAKLSGIYGGNVDGWYGVDTQGALAKLVGNPAPACFERPTGGPKNPQEYWSPVGT